MAMELENPFAVFEFHPSMRIPAEFTFVVKYPLSDEPTKRDFVALDNLQAN